MVYEAAASTFHSPWAVETLSATSRGTVTGPVRHAEEVVVLLTGVEVSIETKSSTHRVHSSVPDSRTRWVKRCVPSPVTAAVPEAADCGAPQSTIHSKLSTLVPARARF